MKQSETRFSGYDCIRLENSALSLWITRDVGPRIIGLALPGGANLLAVVPGAVYRSPGGAVYRFRGGHRLWHAPEDPERSYVPDDAPVAIKAMPDGVQTTQNVEALTGIRKQLVITLLDSEARVVIDHVLTNYGASAVRLAPWAITQLKPGGFAILPQTSRDTGLLPNRRLAFWPYARLNSAHLQFGERFVFVHARMEQEKFKVGWANTEGWLAYWVDETLFVKEAQYQDQGIYYDYGSSSECYCDDRFLELETLGPATTLAPGVAVTHREVWQIIPDVRLKPDETEVQDVVCRHGIPGRSPARGE